MKMEEILLTGISLDEMVRREKNEYAKAWRAKNPDKVRANNRRYWERKALEKMNVGEVNAKNANDGTDL